MEIKRFPNPAEIGKFFQDWWQLLSAIVTALAGALITINVESSLAHIIASALTIVGLTLVFVLYRKASRQRNRIDSVEKEIGKENSTATSFRGLRRFLRGEQLPGSQRRALATQLFRQIVHPDFRLAIVAGDSGCGKSSLLECALLDILEQSKYSVAMISSPSRLLPSGPVGSKSPVESLVVGIQHRAFGLRRENDVPAVLILDQFEELLSRVQSTEDRNALGDGLHAVIKEGVRVIFGIRKENFLDFKSIAQRFDPPVTFEDTFQVHNFDQNEAARVILECVMRDGIDFDQELPSLIAADLAIDGMVRPADLQIVCTILSSDFTTDRYQSEGRAAGLRSRFIKGVIDFTGDAVLARTVLRELCDIPNNKKAPDPLRADYIAKKAVLAAPGPRATTEAVTAVLQSLEQARVAIEIDPSTESRWTLIHDYLVEPIKLATQEQTALAEAAAARLSYYLVKARSTRSIIPLQELRVIRKDAPPAAVRELAARRLILYSLLVGYSKSVTGILVAALVAAATIVGVGAHREWQEAAEGQPKHQFSGSVVASSTVETLQGYEKLVVVMKIINYLPGSVSMWDMQTGDLIGELVGDYSILGGRLWNYKEGELRIFDATGREMEVHVTSPSERPPELDSVKAFRHPHVTLESRLSYKSVDDIYDLETKTWRTIEEDQVFPSNVDKAPSVIDHQSSGIIQVLSTSLRKEGSQASRLTIWTAGYKEKLLDEQASQGPFILHVAELDSEIVVTLIRRRTIERIVLGHTADDVDVLRIDSRTVTDLPKEFPLGNSSSWRHAVQTLSTDDHRLLIVGPSGLREILWLINPSAADFGEPMIATQMAPIFGSNREYIGYIWIPEEKPSLARILLKDNSAITSLKNLSFHSTDRIELSDDRSRLLAISKNGIGTLWKLDLTNGAASLVTSFPPPQESRRDDYRGDRNVFFSADGKMIILHRQAGRYSVWNRDGVSLGDLPTLPNPIDLVTYQPECSQILIWTSNGKRLALRRGFAVPVFDFLPEKDCAAEKGWTRSVLEVFLGYFDNIGAASIN